MIPPSIVEPLRRVRCCVVGAHALSVYGAARYTAYVDVLTMSPRVLAPSFWPDGLAPELRSGDADGPLAGLVRFEAPAAVDVIVGRGEVMRAAVDGAVPLDGVPIPVVTPTSLAPLKLEAGGVQDLADVELLLEARRRSGDPLEARVGGAPLSDWGRGKWAEVQRRMRER